MAVSITHSFVSPITDAGNPNEVGPDEWNAAHTLSGTLDAAQMPALTGDVTTSAGSVATTLATVNGNVGTFGSATKASVVTVNAKGLVTAASESTVTPAASSITGAGDLTKADDTNVTITLGGTPTGALLKATSITVGWTGTLAASRGGTGISSLGTGIATWLGTPSSANLAAALTDETGTGAAVFANTPTLVTPVLGTPGSGTLTNCTGLPISSGVSGLGTGVATFLATPSSANLASAVTDETGSGALVFGTSPTLSNPVVGTQSARDNSTKAASTAYVDAAARDKLTANRTYYVRTDGSDSNTGTADSAGGAFLTIQKAIDTVASIDLASYAVTIQVGSGTYTGTVTLKSYVGAGPVTLKGDTTTPSNVLLSVTSPSTGACIYGANAFGEWNIQGFKTRTTTSGYHVQVQGRTYVNFSNMEFDTAPTAFAHIIATRGAYVRMTGNYAITGGITSGQHIWCETGAIVEAQSITVSGGSSAHAFGTFVLCARSGTVYYGSVTWSGTGSFTGVRFDSSGNSSIITLGGGANYFPGNSAGSGDPGSYDGYT